MEHIAIALIIFFSFVQVRSESAEKQAYLAHIMRVGRFKCGPPQPRTVELSDIMDTSPDVKFLPACTVLHRCENSGCCDGNKICKPSKFEEVPLVFNKIHRGPRGRYIHEYVKVTAKNHTECSCENRISRPK